MRFAVPPQGSPHCPLVAAIENDAVGVGLYALELPELHPPIVNAPQEPFVIFHSC